MTDRPTPEQIAESDSDIIHIAKDQLLADLRFYGYVIVHPDDVPLGKDSPSVAGFRTEIYGWDACRRHIFGGDS